MREGLGRCLTMTTSHMLRLSKFFRLFCSLDYNKRRITGEGILRNSFPLKIKTSGE